MASEEINVICEIPLQVKRFKINSFCLIVVEMKTFVYKITKDSFRLLQIYIHVVIVHGSVTLLNKR
jgi:hypothetical protein